MFDEDTDRLLRGQRLSEADKVWLFGVSVIFVVWIAGAVATWWAIASLIS